MSFTSAQLATELTNDPKALGYAATVHSSYAALAAKVNATYAGVGMVLRNDLTAREILACLTWAEVATFTAAQWAAFQAFLIPGSIDASNTNISAMFLGLFPNASFPVTRAALIAVGKKVAPSRAEELWGYNTRVTDQDIALALGNVT